MSLLVTGLVWKHADIGGSALLVLLAMADIADDKGEEIWPSMETLAAKGRCDVRTVRRMLRMLESEKGGNLISQVERTTGRPGHFNAWRINLNAVILSCPDGLYGKKPRDHKGNKEGGHFAPRGLSTGHHAPPRGTNDAETADIHARHIDNGPRTILESSFPRGGAAPEGAAARVQWEKLRSRLPAGVFLAHLAPGIPVAIEAGVLVVEFDGTFSRERAQAQAEAITRALNMPVRFDLTAAARAKLPRRA